MGRFVRTVLVIATALCAAVSAQADSLRVLGTEGTVEIQKGARGRWERLAGAGRPAIGDRIRTAEKSTADFAFDAAFDGMARLGERTSVRIAAAAVWNLERGKIWVLWEYEEGVRGSFTIRAADYLDATIEGGAFVDAAPPRVEIRSFGSVAVSSDGQSQGVLEEGFRGVVNGEDADAATRLGYAEYQEWRTWMVEAYHHKDTALRPQ